MRTPRPLTRTAAATAAVAVMTATVVLTALPTGAAIAAGSEPVTVRLRNIYNGLCLSQYIRDYVTPGQECNGGTGQQWEETGPANARTFKNRYTGQCLGYYSHDGGRTMGLDCNGRTGQGWSVF